MNSEKKMQKIIAIAREHDINIPEYRYYDRFEKEDKCKPYFLHDKGSLGWVSDLGGIEIFVLEESVEGWDKAVYVEDIDRISSSRFLRALMEKLDNAFYFSERDRLKVWSGVELEALFQDLVESEDHDRAICEEHGLDPDGPQPYQCECGSWVQYVDDHSCYYVAALNADVAHFEEAAYGTRL